MIYPSYFLKIASVDLQDPKLISLVVQFVMFGMGTQINVSDFIGVARMPKAVLIGIAC